MATITTIRTELERRLNDTANVVWSELELDGFIEFAIAGLYPTYYNLVTASTTAGAGPIQTLPATARNLHYVGLQSVGSTRVRPVRGWSEGTGQVVIPKIGITGATLVFAWTAPFAAPVDEFDDLEVPREAEEVLVLRSQVTALEKLLTDRVKQQKFFALQVREGVSEQDIATTIDALNLSIDQRTRLAIPLPEKRA